MDTHRHIHTGTHAHIDTQGHTGTQGHTQTHRHTDLHTHTYTHAHAFTHIHAAVHQECFWRMESWALGSWGGVLGEASVLLFTLCFCSFPIKKNQVNVLLFPFKTIFKERVSFVASGTSVCACLRREGDETPLVSALTLAFVLCPWELRLSDEISQGWRNWEMPQQTSRGWLFTSIPGKQFAEMVRNGYLLCFQKRDSERLADLGGEGQKIVT